MSSLLTSKEIKNVNYANVEFGEDTSLMVARPDMSSFCCCLPLPWISVPEGYYALVTRFGKEEICPETDSYVWPSGFHLGLFHKVEHLVTKQSMIFNCPVKGCKTSDNVTVEIDINIVLRVMGDEKGSSVIRKNDDPDNVRKFVHNLTASGLQQQLADAQAEAVRTMARSVTHTEVFGLRSISAKEMEANLNRVKIAATEEFVEDDIDHYSDEQEKKDLEGEHDEIDDEEAMYAVEHSSAMVTKKLKSRLNKQFNSQGIEILEVIIENISLPGDIQNQMSQKTMVISQNAEQRMQHKFDMQVLEQTEAIKMIQQRHKEEAEELRTDGEAKEVEEKLKLDFMKEDAKKEISKIQLQSDRDVGIIKAESSLKVRKINETCKKEIERIELSAKAESAVTYSETAYDVAEIKAKSQLECAQLAASGDKTLFKAEGTSAPKIRTLREYVTNQKKIEVQDALASNDKVVVTGKNGGTAANNLLLAEACISSASKSGTSNGIAELAVASGKADVRLYMAGGESSVARDSAARGYNFKGRM